MKGLRALGVEVGGLPAGTLDAITDIEGVQVGHIAMGGEDLNIGMSAVLPYSLDVKERELSIGRWSLDGGGAISGLGVAEDFGAFSSPIVFAPAPVFGRVYEALIQQGIQRDSGLSTGAGWPPIVLGVDDGAANDARRVYESAREEDVQRVLAAASSGEIAEGNVGIGRALRAFGVRGGVGTASRLAGSYSVGVFVAVNGGLPTGLVVAGQSLLSETGAPSLGPQEFAAVIATDAPLAAFELRALAQRGGLGAGRCGLWNPHTRAGQVLAFSTVESKESTVDKTLKERPALEDDELYALFAACVEAVEAAILSALVAATPLRVGGQTLGVLPAAALQKLKGKK